MNSGFPLVKVIAWITLFFAQCSLFSVDAQVNTSSLPSGSKALSDVSILKRAIEHARKQGDIHQAETLTGEFHQLALAENTPISIADSYFQQARNAMERNNYEPAHELLNQAIGLYEAQNNQVGLAIAYRQLGLTYRYQSNYPQALEYIYLAMQISQQLNDQPAIASTYNSIGLVLEKMGLLEGAAQAHQQALELHYELENKDGIASALYNLGDLRRLMGDHTLALNYFKDALAIDLASGGKKYIAYSHNKVGYQYVELGDYQKAQEHLNTALALFKQIQAPRDTDWALTSMARLEMELGNLEQSRALLDGVIARAIKQNYKSLLVDAYRLSASLALKSDDTKLAIQHIDAGVAQAQSNNETHDEALLEALRVQAYIKEDALRLAFDALLAQKKLEDETLHASRINTIATLQSQTEFVRRAQQIKLLEQEKALSKVKQEQFELGRNVSIAGIVGIFVLFVLIYSRINQRNLNKRLTREVALRTTELEQKNIELQAAYQEMEAISLTDKLTGVHNRRFLENQIGADLEKSQRVYTDWHDGKTPQPQQADIVVFMIDMDHFKRVNDEYGHGAGDEVLQQLTQRLALVFRQSDYIVRWGGEEFVGVARFINRSDASNLAQRLLEEVGATPFTLSNGASTYHTCSVGYACYPRALHHNQANDWQTLIALADTCLYEAKNNGRNAWVGIECINAPSANVTDIATGFFESGAHTDKIKVVTSFTSANV